MAPDRADDGQGGLGQLRRGLGGVEDDRAGGQGVDRGPAGVDPLLAPGPHPPPTTNKLAKTIARYGRVDLLCIDELGYMALDRRGAELPFQVPTEREEKNAVAIASNESFGGWTKTFTDPRPCAAIVDRLCSRI